MAKKSFKQLSEREILALAIQLEEEDSRIYGDFADGLRETYPATAKSFDDMQAEESRHRQQLIDMYRQRFGEHIPLIRRQDVKGFVERRSTWLVRPLGINAVRKQVEVMEAETRRFYERALQQVSNPDTRKLLGDLAEVERQHWEFAASLRDKQVESGERAEEDKSQKRLFMLQIIQPGLAGLMDGSVSTLAPIFAAAFATHTSKAAFLVGLAASIGAGISMAFAEALSDDGSLTGRGQSVRARRRDRADDDGWRPRAHAAVYDFKFSSGVYGGCDCGGRGTRDHQLRAAPVHGYTAAVVRVSGGGGRRFGFRGRDSDREFVALKEKRKRSAQNLQ